MNAILVSIFMLVVSIIMIPLLFLFLMEESPYVHDQALVDQNGGEEQDGVTNIIGKSYWNFMYSMVGVYMTMFVVSIYLVTKDATAKRGEGRVTLIYLIVGLAFLIFSLSVCASIVIHANSVDDIDDYEISNYYGMGCAGAMVLYVAVVAIVVSLSGSLKSRGERIDNINKEKKRLNEKIEKLSNSPF